MNNPTPAGQDRRSNRNDFNRLKNVEDVNSDVAKQCQRTGNQNKASEQSRQRELAGSIVIAVYYLFKPLVPKTQA